jgi:hypothetical protein
MVNSAEHLLATTPLAGKGRARSLVLRFNASVSMGNLRATMLPWQTELPDLMGGQ